MHDRQAMQHFVKSEVKALVQYILEECPEDLHVGGHIACLHVHSDNASHFKSTSAINCYTALVCDRGVLRPVEMFRRTAYICSISLVLTKRV